MPNISSLTIALAAGALLMAAGLLVAPAGAAVRVCQDLIVSGPHQAATETEARKQAMAGWISSAAKHGKGYTSWQLATDRDAQCARGADGRFACAVKGRPCTIQQNPAPQRPRPPRSQGIET